MLLDRELLVGAEEYNYRVILPGQYVGSCRARKVKEY